MSKYIFKPYSFMFPELFLKESERIVSSCGETIEIEHVGSSAVPGLGGKGIIDIAIATGEKDQILSKLQHLGYEYYPQYSTDTRFFLKTKLSDPEEGMRTYHIHLVFPQSKEWKHLLFFRDYLKAHPEERDRYAELKKRASVEAHEHGDVYRKLKQPFIEREILQKKYRPS